MPTLYSRLKAVARLVLLASMVLAVGAAQGQVLGLRAVGAQSLPATYADLGSSGAAIATPNFDDANSAPQNIGFSFTFGGSTFTQFVLNTNGYVKLGATAPPTPYFSTTPLTVAGGPLKGAGTYLLVPFNTDLEAAASGGTEYRVATTGSLGSQVCTIQWKNVSDKSRAAIGVTVDKQLASLSFQLKLYEGSNQVEFVYGPAVAATVFATVYNAFAHVGLKGAGSGQLQVLTVTKPGTAEWSTPTFQDGTYPDYTDGFVFTGQPTSGGGTVLPDAGRTYRFTPPVVNDLAVRTLYGIEQLPAGQAFVYRAYITNPGSTSVSGQTATLTLAGVTSQTATVAIPTLTAGAAAVVRFAGLTLPVAGSVTVTVQVPADGNNTNNSLTATTLATTSANFFSYISGASPSGEIGFLLNPQAGFTSAYAVKYQARTAYSLNVVRARLGSAPDNVGNTVYGVIADTTGAILAQSAPYQMQQQDLNTLHTFALTASVTVPAGAFLAGLAQVRTTSTYPAPLAVQPEVPTRPSTFYTFGISTPSTPVDITSTNAPNYRYLIDVGSTTVLATAATALAGTLALYPNPAANGRFALDVRGAGSGPLAVAVLNTLGQQVYAGPARAEATTQFDLGCLAEGVYYLQVRSGTATTTRKLMITR